MAMVKGFDSFDEMLDYVNEQAEAENIRTQQTEAWQKLVIPGVYFVRRDTQSGVFVWGQILECEHEEDREMMALATFRGKRWCRAASVLCPESELGMIHVADVELLITAEQFQEAKARSWPSQPAVVCEVVGIDTWNLPSGSV